MRALATTLLAASLLLFFFRIIVSSRAGFIFTDHFSGPGRAIGPVCVCLRVRTVTVELDDL